MIYSDTYKKLESAIKHFEAYVDNEAYSDFHQECCRMAISALKEKLEKIPGMYTLEEMKNLGTQYIWTKVIHGHGIADGTVRHKLWIPEVKAKDLETYGTDWVAYDKDPEAIIL